MIWLETLVASIADTPLRLGLSALTSTTLLPFQPACYVTKLNHPSIMEHAQDFDDGRLDCTVSNPRKENEGSKDAYVSYLITTKTNFKSFQVGFAPRCL
jgi:hypothetical protein